jgi:hypothetical protein
VRICDGCHLCETKDAMKHSMEDYEEREEEKEMKES